MKCDGKWIDVQLMEDAVLVNLGALMQRWTSDRYMATVSVYSTGAYVYYHAARA